MSETQTATPPQPKGTHTVTDDNGRVLQVRSLGLLEEMDLIEAAGTPTPPERWMMIATLASCVRSIDGVPLICPVKRLHIRAQVQRVGPAGLRAVVKALAPELPPEAGEAVDGDAAVPDPLAIVKN